MTDRPPPAPVHDALKLTREALRVARTHLKSHPGYSIKVASCIELAEREADRALGEVLP